MKNLLVILLCSMFVFSANAASLKGEKFPDTIQLENKTLVLNGLGLRLAKKFFLKFKVYVAGLYLEKKNSNPKEIYISKENKRLELRFLRNVEGEKIADAYRSGLKDNGVDVKAFKKEIDELTSKIEDIKEKDKIIFDFLPSEIRVQHGSIKYKITNKSFFPHLLKLWIGKAPNPEIKTGLLGL